MQYFKGGNHYIDQCLQATNKLTILIRVSKLVLHYIIVLNVLLFVFYQRLKKKEIMAQTTDDNDCNTSFMHVKTTVRIISWNLVKAVGGRSNP